MLGNPLQQMTGERRNIAAAVAERRQGDGGRADPFGEAGMEIVGQRSAAGRDDPDVDGIAAVEPDRADFAGREHAVEQLLRLGGKDAISSRTSVPPSAWTSLPILAAKAPGKAPFSWPNSSLSMMFAATALQSSVEQRPLGAKARAVDCAGEGFLARAGLADDQDRQAVARRLGGDRQGRAEFGGGANQLLERQFGRQFLGNGRELACGAAAVGVGGKRFEQPLRRDRANQEVRCAGAHRFDSDATVSPCDRTMIGRFGRCPRSDAISCGPLLASQLPSSAACTSRPCGPCSSASAVSSSAAPTTLQPARAGDRRDQPALFRIGIQQQQRTDRFFAHRSLGDSLGEQE